MTTNLWVEQVCVRVYYNVIANQIWTTKSVVNSDELKIFFFLLAKKLISRINSRDIVRDNYLNSVLLRFKRNHFPLLDEAKFKA